jgi:hypothetical protein
MYKATGFHTVACLKTFSQSLAQLPLTALAFSGRWLRAHRVKAQARQ